MKKTFLLALALALGGSVHAEEKQSATDAFRGQTQYHILMCRIKVKTAIIKSEMGESGAGAEIGTCIKDGKAEVKKLYPAALKRVAKNGAASKILKDYYASWLTAFDGVVPAPSERKIDYERRQTASEAKYDEYWNRLEVEAGI